MTFIGKLDAAGPFSPGRSMKRAMVGILVAVVLSGAPWALSVPAAGADPTTQVQAVQAEMVTGAARIHALTEAYNQANLTSISLGQQLSTDQARLRAMQVAVSASEASLRRQAVLSYTRGGVGRGSNGGAATDVGVRDEYLTVVVGNVTDSVDHYRVDQQQLEAQTAQIAAEDAGSRQAVAAADRARQRAVVDASSEQDRLAQLQAQLVQLARVVSVSTSASPKSSQGGPVGNGLVKVVSGLVGSPTASAPKATAPATTAPAPANLASQPPAPTTTPTTATPTTSAPPATGAGATGGVWLQLRECESGDNYQANTGNGFYGAYQFSAQTWTDLGYPGRPDQEPPGMQDTAAQRLQAQSGWSQWPSCSAALGLH